MKFKTYYLYIIIVIAAAAVLLIVTNAQRSKQNTEVKMPKDEVHKGLTDQMNAPGKGNVSENAIHQMEMLKKAAEQNPDDTLKIREYADFLGQAHKQDEAIRQYEKILQKYPKRTDIILSIAFIHYNRREFKDAEDELNKILAIDKNHLQARYNLGAIAANQGDYAKAKIIWTQLVKDYPGTEMATLAKESLSRL